ncbi:hypothetical protein Q427_21855 [Halomonas sp. BC04]|nr:hypothetical protein Q427_21855 [Halomonas sp. BC04]
MPGLEAEWAERLADCYLIDAADIATTTDSVIRGMVTSRYRSDQGHFMIRLPSERCFTLPTPTTVEHIAAWLARQITEETGRATRVQAFEGVDKGAIAEAQP